jgi:RNA polymerase sigma-70 factor (ECF subfamily)
MTLQEYNVCVDEFADGIYRFVLKNARNSELARDVVQETFTKFWEKKYRVDPEKSKSYLFTTAYHTMLDYLKKDKRHGEMGESVEATLRVVREDHTDLNDILHEALDTLPEIQRTVILLRDYEGYAYDEIGEICELSESQVKVYIFRARKALKKYLVSIDMVI